MCSVQKGDRHELKREESEKNGALSVQTKSEEASIPGSPSNGATFQTPNHMSLEVSATKVQVLNKSENHIHYHVISFKLDGFHYYSLPISIALKETSLGEEQTASNGVAGGNNGDLGGNGVLLGGDSDVVGGGNGVLGGANGVPGCANGVLRSNTGFVSI